MLKVTENAAAALESIRHREGIPEDQDIRLTADPQPTGDVGVRLEFVETVGDEDEVAKKAGTEVYVDPAIAEPLTDTVMDVQDSDEGLAFVFRPQAPEA